MIKMPYAHPLKVLQVSHQFLPDHVGGIEIYVRNLARELHHLGIDILLLNGDGKVLHNPSGSPDCIDGLRSIHMHDRGGSKVKRFSFFKTFKNSEVLKLFEQAVREYRPDAIHFHHTMYLSGELIFAAKRLGIPVVITIHDFWFLCHKLHLVDWRETQCGGPSAGIKCAFCFFFANQGLLGWFNAVLGGIPLVYRTRYHLNVLRSADFLVTPAAFVRQILKQYLGGGKKIRHIPYGISTSDIFSSPSIRSDNIRFGYLGTIKRHKGIHVLIEAFNELVHEKASLDIYGNTGSDAAYYRDLIKSCQNGRITFKGAYDNRDVGRVLKDIDVLIVPSIWRETGPMVVLEALANGVPVIASNVGGMSELIQDGGNGFLFETGNPRSLLRCIRNILEMPALLTDLSPRLASKHQIDHNAQVLCDIYKSLVS